MNSHRTLVVVAFMVSSIFVAIPVSGTEDQGYQPLRAFLPDLPGISSDAAATVWTSEGAKVMDAREAIALLVSTLPSRQGVATAGPQGFPIGGQILLIEHDETGSAPCPQVVSTFPAAGVVALSNVATQGVGLAVEFPTAPVLTGHRFFYDDATVITGHIGILVCLRDDATLYAASGIGVATSVVGG